MLELPREGCGCLPAKKERAPSSWERMFGFIDVVSQLPRWLYDVGSMLECWLSDLLQKEKDQEGDGRQGKANGKVWSLHARDWSLNVINCMVIDIWSIFK